MRTVSGALVIGLLVGCASSGDETELEETAPVDTFEPVQDADPATTRFAPPDLGDWPGDLALPAPSELPEGFEDLDATYLSALSCGPYPENLFDIIVPEVGAPPPLLFFVHGGGFTGGSRLDSLREGRNRTLRYLDEGFAYATVDYRFRTEDGVRRPLQDVRVCLQFVRRHADALGFDPERIVLAGGSAGAGTSLWIATHDDLAEPDHLHPVLRQSTEVRGIAITGTQATYDIFAWDDVFSPEYADFFELAMAVPRAADELLAFYDVDDADALFEEPYLSYRAAVHMLPKIDADDPPIWIQNSRDDTDPIVDPLHHPYHSRAVI
ncbi:MAG: alpha/beta hydrolase fold domain-containing protein, partial [Myxococcota bacterium]